MEAAGPPTRYLTLRDYVRVLRRYVVAIGLIAVIGAAAGYIDAKRQSPTYKATASVSFTDPAQELTLAGLSPGLVQPPATLAAQNAETLSRPQIILSASRSLNTSQPLSRLSGAVSGQVSGAGLLDITASWSNAAFAARLANATAEAVAAQSNAQTRASFTLAADGVRSRIADLRAGSSGPGAGARLLVYEDELARLDTLSKFAQSAQVAQLAGAPATPASPHPLRSVLIGLVLGLVLGIAVAFVRDSFDRRLRTARDVESSLPLPILGHVRIDALGKIACSTREIGAAQQPDVEAFRILRQNLESLSGPPRSIVVTSAIPEEGKTTVAGSLAFALAAGGKRTLLVDCDLRRPALAGRLEIQAAPGISDFLAGAASPQQILRPIALGTPPNLKDAHANGHAPAMAKLLVAIPAGSRTSDSAELLGSRRFQEFLQQVVQTYDVVVIDSAPLLPVADTLEMLPHVEGALVCARESKTTRDEAVAARRALERFPNLSVGVVVTGIRSGHSDYGLYTRAYSYS